MTRGLYKHNSNQYTELSAVINNSNAGDQNQNPPGRSPITVAKPNKTSDPSKRSSNYLSQQQQYQLWDWLNKNRDKLHDKPVTYVEVASKATRELKFFLNERNARSAMKSAGIEVRATRNTPAKTSSILLETVNQNRIRLDDLEIRIMAIENGLGIDPPTNRSTHSDNGSEGE